MKKYLQSGSIFGCESDHVCFSAYGWHSQQTRYSNELMKLPLLVTKKQPVLRSHVYFLFSVQLIAAVYPFMSNHRCPYPHIPVPGSSSKPVAVCFTAALKVLLAFPAYCQSSSSRCALLYTPLSLFLSRSLIFLCHMHSSLPLTMSSVSLLFLHAVWVWLPLKHLMYGLNVRYFPILPRLPFLSLSCCFCFVLRLRFPHCLF